MLLLDFVIRGAETISEPFSAHKTTSAVEKQSDIIQRRRYPLPYLLNLPLEPYDLPFLVPNGALL